MMRLQHTFRELPLQERGRIANQNLTPQQVTVAPKLAHAREHHSRPMRASVVSGGDDGGDGEGDGESDGPLPPEAIQFLRLLDPNAARFTFQTAQDRPTGVKITRPELARILHSPVELRHFNKLGAGIFVAVNETDLRGRKTENIIRIRAVWNEDDHGYAGRFPLPPSIVVETSRGRYHRYWLTNWPADEQGRADHRAVMERMIADYASDHSAKDVTRALRLPGFYHLKYVPFLVRIISAAGHRYTREQILAAFPPIPRKPVGPARPWRSHDVDDEQIVDALDHIPADDREVWLAIGMALKDYYGEKGRALWDRWSQTSSKFDPKTQNYVWKSFRKIGITIRTLFALAYKNGWRPKRDKYNPVEQPLWSAAGKTIAHFPEHEAHVRFADYFGRHPQIVSWTRAEQIFETILAKHRTNGATRRAAP
jgi:hypothetical protein